jgi:hypothetical protein
VRFLRREADAAVYEVGAIGPQHNATFPIQPWFYEFMRPAPIEGTVVAIVVNPLVAESVRVLIDTAYEAFYARYRNDFGHTFAGFFSDEPGFYRHSDNVLDSASHCRAVATCARVR